MRKILIALGAAAVLGGSWVAEAAPDDRPEARAYFSYAFGGHNRYEAPLRYGLRMDMAAPLYAPGYARLNENVAYSPEVFARTAAVKLEGDLLGNATASLAGIPFAGRVARLNEDDSTTAAPATPGGFTWFDWTLVGVGLGGVGFLVAKATQDHSSH